MSKVQYFDPFERTTATKINSYANAFAGCIKSIILDGNVKELFENQYASSYISLLETRTLFADSVFFKNAAFVSEKEWRILLDDDELNKTNDDWIEYYNWSEDNEDKKNKSIRNLIPKGIEFNDRKNDICSYMDLSFKEYDEIIDEVVLGPNCRLSVDDTVQIMNHFFFEYFNDTNVNKSKCPYIARR